MVRGLNYEELITLDEMYFSIEVKSADPVKMYIGYTFNRQLPPREFIVQRRKIEESSDSSLSERSLIDS